MQKLLITANAVINVFVNLLLSPIFNSYFRQSIDKFDVLPGQAWDYPGIGKIVVTAVTDKHITYTVPDEDDYLWYIEDAPSFTVQRHIFIRAVWYSASDGVSQVISETVNSTGNVIAFPFKD
jgi:hypothetical protein